MDTATNWRLVWSLRNDRDHEDDDTDEEEYANEHLEAESMLNEEGHDAKDWYLNQLNDKHESTTRANLEPKDIKNLIKELMQPQWFTDYSLICFKK